MFIKWLKSSEKCEQSTRFRKLRKISIFWDFSKKSLFKLNFKIEVLAKWTVADLGLFRTDSNHDVIFGTSDVIHSGPKFLTVYRSIDLWTRNQSVCDTSMTINFWRAVFIYYWYKVNFSEEVIFYENFIRVKFRDFYEITTVAGGFTFSQGGHIFVITN